MSELAMIWAQARGGVIGQGGTMPWHLPEDLTHFKALTLGSPVVMGRRTWDSLPPRFRPLEGRRNVVVSRQQGWTAEGAEVVSSIPEALALTAAAPTTWITGGATLYAELMPVADRLEVTEIDAQYDGDTHAPPVDGWQVDGDPEWLTSRTGLRYRFLTYRRR